MSKMQIGLKFRRMLYKIKHGFFSIENVVLIGAIVLCLVWTYQSVNSMTRNWELAEKLNSEKKSLELLSVELEALELENEYYASEEYQELAARRFLNKQLSGEKMVYLPENSEVARNKHQVVKTEVVEKTYSNPEKWMMLLFPNA